MTKEMLGREELSPLVAPTLLTGLIAKLPARLLVTDKQQRILGCSKMLAAELSLPIDSIVGRRLDELLPVSWLEGDERVMGGARPSL
ncbi:hypothetical protein [Aeromonas schubertii]|uniref:hypothetical protein n=1 Tax=Aeromonas schubertii TaxID=652 RepID=UPI0010A81DA7|nr:hypothetical protein [Aeromonas schubertii]QCG48542.1 hypothetical protein E2P79_12480 [Aeromonas schubertii]